jgi:ParB family chromosome partitioning protein
VREAVERHDLTERHARALLRLHEPDAQLDIVNTVVLKSLNVRQTEDLIERRVINKLNPEDERPRGEQKFSRAWRDWRLFANSMKTAVNELKASGLDAQFTLNDLDSQVEMRVVVPKGR